MLTAKPPGMQVAMPQRSYLSLESYYIKNRSKLIRHAQRGYNRRAEHVPSTAGVEAAVAGDNTSGEAQGSTAELGSQSSSKPACLLKGVYPAELCTRRTAPSTRVAVAAQRCYHEPGNVTWHLQRNGTASLFRDGAPVHDNNQAGASDGIARLRDTACVA